LGRCSALAEELAVLAARAVAAAVLVAGEAAVGAAVAPPQLRDGTGIADRRWI